MSEMSSAHVPFQLVDADEFEALEVAIAAAECSSTLCKKQKTSENATCFSYRGTCCAQLWHTATIGLPISSLSKPACTTNSERDTAHLSRTSSADVFQEHFENGPSIGILSRLADANQAARISETAVVVEGKTHHGDFQETTRVSNSSSDLQEAPDASTSKSLSEADECATILPDRTHEKSHSTGRLPLWQTNLISCGNVRQRSSGDANIKFTFSGEEGEPASGSNVPDNLSDLCNENSRRPWGLAPSTCTVLAKWKAPYLQFKGRIHYSVTTLDAENAAHELLRHVEAKKGALGNPVALGFDAEWKAIFKRGAPQSKVAVLQLCIDSDNCNVFHVIHTGIPSSLRTILEDPLVCKVGVGAYGDASRVRADYGVKVTGVKDLSSMANVKLDSSKSWSLSSLTEELLGKQLEKNNKIRCGDWEVEELSEVQLRYAATDAFASLYLFQVAFVAGSTPLLVVSFKVAFVVLVTFSDPQKKEAMPSGDARHMDPCMPS